jgi:cytochrome bd-type quinol oxidase subunit 2
MLSIVSVFIPLMIFYNAYQYPVFRGKLEKYAGYGVGPNR